MGLCREPLGLGAAFWIASGFSLAQRSFLRIYNPRTMAADADSKQIARYSPSFAVSPVSGLGTSGFSGFSGSVASDSVGGSSGSVSGGTGSVGSAGFVGSVGSVGSAGSVGSGISGWEAVTEMVAAAVAPLSVSTLMLTCPVTFFTSTSAR